MAEYNYLIGIPLMLGLAIFFTYITYQDTKVFLIFLNVFCAFMVWSNLLPMWTMILTIIGLIIVVYLSQTTIKTKGVN